MHLKASSIVVALPKNKKTFKQSTDGAKEGGSTDPCMLALSLPKMGAMHCEKSVITECLLKLRIGPAQSFLDGMLETTSALPMMGR